MNTLSAVLAAGTVSAIAGLTALPASAVSFTGTGAGFAIRDHTTNTSDINVPANFLITDITVTLNVSAQ